MTEQDCDYLSRMQVSTFVVAALILAVGFLRVCLVVGARQVQDLE
jgi:hypothetical protein